MTNYHFWRGDRIRLRAIEQKDLDAVARSFEDIDTEAERYEAEIPFPVSREQDRANLEALSKREPGNDSFSWMVEDLEGQHVGYIGTFDCDRRVGAFKYAILLCRPFWGRGYAREAIMIVLRYYFCELRYQKVTALVYSFNERSLRMHEKLGFTFEGRIRRMVYTNGRHYDQIYFGMTSEEFDRIDSPLDLWEDTMYGVSPRTELP
jgi:RimJ/RimL family protein N-acetyltransferase